MNVRPEHLASLAATLNRHQVDYLLIGGLAARLHGARRPTTDLDVLTGQTDVNLDRLAAALNELGANYRGSPVAAKNLRGGNSRWQTSVGLVDVLWDATGPGHRIGYADVSERGVIAQLFDVEIPVISLVDLVILKSAAGRPKDIAALRDLHRVHPNHVPRQPEPCREPHDQSRYSGPER